MVDLVWSSMRDGELYSPWDLANWSLQPTDAVTRVLEFLTRYGFAEQVVKRQPLFRKLEDAPDPCEALRILQRMMADESPRSVESIAKIRKH